MAFLLLAASSAGAQGTPGDRAASSATFRPGTAAAPFGWASTIADFNADGRPDFVVADRVAGRDDANYRIDLRLSSGRNQSLLFTSALRALTVEAVDVDNDRDIDLVVRPVLGREVVGVWLNDGSGHFRRGRPRDLPSGVPTLSPAGIRRSVLQFALAGPMPRRDVIPPSSPAGASWDPLSAGPSASSVGCRPRLLVSGLSSRAPPTHA